MRMDASLYVRCARSHQTINTSLSFQLSYSAVRLLFLPAFETFQSSWSSFKHPSTGACLCVCAPLTCWLIMYMGPLSAALRLVFLKYILAPVFWFFLEIWWKTSYRYCFLKHFLMLRYVRRNVYSRWYVIDILLVLMEMRSACYFSDVMSALQSPNSPLNGRTTGHTVMNPGAAAIVGHWGVGCVFVTFQVTPCFALA